MMKVMMRPMMRLAKGANISTLTGRERERERGKKRERGEKREERQASCES